MKKLIVALAIVASTPAYAFTQESNQNWLKYTKWAFYRSQAQFGEAKQIRGCQPELKICNQSIHYFDKNKNYTIARDILDINDNVIARDVCRFNKAGDIRTCVDWDSGATTKEMQDINKKWVRVDDSGSQQPANLGPTY